MTGSIPRLLKAAATCTIVSFAGGCGESPVAPMDAGQAASTANAQSATACVNIAVDGTATLGPVEFAPGQYGFGAQPTAVTIAGVDGTLSSVVTGMVARGSKGQGAQALTLIHMFESAEGGFTTVDRAVCAPAGSSPAVCRVNDALSVVSGTGVFANASGMLHNHGIIDLGASTVTIRLHGRLCGDGL